ncbi:MAG: DNA/RNA nuclease SfsA [Anaerolineae bacterium]
MRLPSPLLDGILVERENRFRARVRLDTSEVLAHVPNPGRTVELLYPGARVLLTPRSEPGRRTAYDLILAYTEENVLVSLDTRFPSRLFSEAMEVGRIAPLAAYRVERAETKFGTSRLDFALTPRQDAAPDLPPCLVEVKSSTYVINGMGLWPDAPSLRGQRHVRELADAVAQGYRAAIVWFVQRPDARCLTPNRAVDPRFGEALDAARAAGVEAYAYTCRVTRKRVEVAAAIPVI